MSFPAEAVLFQKFVLSPVGESNGQKCNTVQPGDREIVQSEGVLPAPCPEYNMADHTDSEASCDLSLPGYAYVCAWTPRDTLALTLDSEQLDASLTASLAHLLLYLSGHHVVARSEHIMTACLVRSLLSVLCVDTCEMPCVSGRAASGGPAERVPVLAAM